MLSLSKHLSNPRAEAVDLRRRMLRTTSAHGKSEMLRQAQHDTGKGPRSRLRTYSAASVGGVSPSPTRRAKKEPRKLSAHGRRRLCARHRDGVSPNVAGVVRERGASLRMGEKGSVLTIGTRSNWSVDRKNCPLFSFSFLFKYYTS
jgi:hypothetical protein